MTLHLFPYTEIHNISNFYISKMKSVHFKLKKKVKYSLFTTLRRIWGVDVQLHLFLTSAPAALPPRKYPVPIKSDHLREERNVCA